MKKDIHMPSQESVEWAAQLWCLPENSNRIMDVGFAMSIARALDKREGERKDK